MNFVLIRTQVQYMKLMRTMIMKIFPKVARLILSQKTMRIIIRSDQVVEKVRHRFKKLNNLLVFFQINHIQ